MMKENEGVLDRAIRVVVGLFIIWLAVKAKTWLGVVGLIPLLTGMFGYCPLYTLMGISTCKKADKK